MSRKTDRDTFRDWLENLISDQQMPVHAQRSQLSSYANLAADSFASGNNAATGSSGTGADTPFSGADAAA
jgi:hypothetical protein